MSWYGYKPKALCKGRELLLPESHEFATKSRAWFRDSSNHGSIIQGQGYIYKTPPQVVPALPTVGRYICSALYTRPLHFPFLSPKTVHVDAGRLRNHHMKLQLRHASAHRYSLSTLPVLRNIAVYSADTRESHCAAVHPSRVAWTSLGHRRVAWHAIHIEPYMNGDNVHASGTWSYSL